VKRFRFSLERVLAVKRRLERQAEMRQQQARAVFEAALAEVARAEARVAQAAGGGEAAYREAVSLGTWQARYEQLAALEQVLESARGQARNAERQLQEASLVRARIGKEVEALLFLRRQQWDRHQEELARRAQEHLDEVGTRRWLAAGRAAKEGEPKGEEQ